MNAYLITYKTSKAAQTKHTCTRFYPDYETACNDCFLAETYPDVVILSMEPTSDPRDNPTEILTPQVAERLGVTVGRVNQLIWAGLLDAHKIGRDWLVDTESIARYQAAPRRGPGRQRKEK